MKYNISNLMESINQHIALDSLKNTLMSLFTRYDREVDIYKTNIYESKIDSDDQSNDSEEILDKANDNEENKTSLKNIIQILNAIQTIFEKLGYSNNTSSPNDVNENNFISQLEQFSKQALNLSEDFDRKYFTSFSEGLYYLTSLSEVHYNNKYGELTENIQITDNAEEMIENTENYLSSLPKIPTNELK